MKKVEVTATEKVLEKFFDVEQLTLRYEGQDEQVTRFRTKTKQAAAILLYNVEKRTVTLAKQFRMAVHEGEEHGYIYEVPAGVLDKGEGETAEDCARREAEEETGYRVLKPEKIGEIYTSPGYTTECISLFFAEVHENDRIGEGGGADGENENIEVTEIAYEQAMEWVRQGKLKDAKTQICLYWLGARLRGE